MANKLESQLTAAQEILLGAADLDRQNKAEFSEWDLTVATWKRDKNRFGCRGYETQYPDHKRVMMEIMGGSKKDNPMRRGWIERTRPNHYRMTDIGRATADRLRSTTGEAGASQRSAQPIYDAVRPYFEHSVFRKFCQNPEEPRMWLGAASFLGITRNDAHHLEDRMRGVRTAVQTALDWLKETSTTQLRRGVTGGGVTITKRDLERLNEFLDVITERFVVQIEALRKSTKQ